MTAIVLGRKTPYLFTGLRPMGVPSRLAWERYADAGLCSVLRKGLRYMANVMLTGAMGRIGRAVTERLLEKGHNVFAVDSMFNTLADDDNFHYTSCEITDEREITAVISNNAIDTVIHIACTVDNDFSETIGDAELKAAKTCDKFIYAAADKAGVKNFILTSTTQIYGVQKGRDPIRETASEKGTTAYAELKMNSEKIMLKAFKKSTTVPVIARLAPIYTPEFTDNLREHVFDRKSNCAYIYGEGNYSFSFCSIYNYIEFIMGIVNIPQGRYEGVYNICDKDKLTAKQILDFGEESFRLGTPEVRTPPRSVIYNKLKGRNDYRYFDPEAALANWSYDNTKAQRISTFRWNLSNTAARV